MIDGGHGLDGVGSGTGKIKGAIDHFAFVEDKRSVAKDHKATVAEFTGVVFVEVEQDFFTYKGVLDDFHDIWDLMVACNRCRSGGASVHALLLGRLP